MNQAFEEIFSKFKGEPGDLIPILQDVQASQGYLQEEAISQIADFVKVSENEIYGVATFYAQFRFTEPGRHTVKVCLGTACHVRGGEALLDTVQRDFNVQPGETSSDKRFTLERVACVGCCALAPVVVVDQDVHANVTNKNLKGLLKSYE